MECYDLNNSAIVTPLLDYNLWYYILLVSIINFYDYYIAICANLTNILVPYLLNGACDDLTGFLT